MEHDGGNFMPLSEAKKRGNKKYRQTLDVINVYLPKGRKDDYKSVALAMGKSLNALVVDALDAYITAYLEEMRKS